MAFNTIVTGEEKTNNFPDGNLHVRVVNVGQGDFITIKTPLGRTIVVDAGTLGKEKFGYNDTAKVTFGYDIRMMTDDDLTRKDRRKGTLNVADYPGAYLVGKQHYIAEYNFSNSSTLISQEYNKLDFLFLTHADLDHYSLVSPILNFKSTLGLGEDVRLGFVFTSEDIEEFDARNINGDILNALRRAGPATYNASSNRHHDRIHTLRVNNGTWKTILREEMDDGREFSLNCLAAGVEAQSWRKLKDSVIRNARSIVLLLRYGNDSVLLTGDANEFTEPAMRDAVDDDDFPDSLSLLQIPHHGASDEQLSKEFLESLKSGQSVLSAPSEMTKHFHPRYSTVLMADETTTEQKTNTVPCWLDPMLHGMTVDQRGKKFVFSRMAPGAASSAGKILKRGRKKIKKEEVDNITSYLWYQKPNSTRKVYLVNYITSNDLISTGSRYADHYVRLDGR